MLSPTTFFLLVVNLVYAFFDTFGTIHALTGGGPGKATETLIYKVYVEGVQNTNLGSSAAQSVILMLLVVALTMIAVPLHRAARALLMRAAIGGGRATGSPPRRRAGGDGAAGR